jgi:hypothetical protein
MFPLPQCPFCGKVSASLTEAITHLDSHAALWEYRPTASPEVEPPDEHPSHIQQAEAEDPSPQHQEEAG